jgi:hypothetical protein
MGRDTLSTYSYQLDILDDIDDKIKWMRSDYTGVTQGRINRVKEKLSDLENTLKSS